MPHAEGCSATPPTAPDLPSHVLDAACEEVLSELSRAKRIHQSYMDTVADFFSSGGSMKEAESRLRELVEVQIRLGRAMPLPTVTMVQAVYTVYLAWGEDGKGAEVVEYIGDLCEEGRVLRGYHRLLEGHPDVIPTPGPQSAAELCIAAAYHHLASSPSFPAVHSSALSAATTSLRSPQGWLTTLAVRQGNFLRTLPSLPAVADPVHDALADCIPLTPSLPHFHDPSSPPLHHFAHRVMHLLWPTSPITVPTWRERLRDKLLEPHEVVHLQKLRLEGVVAAVSVAAILVVVTEAPGYWDVECGSEVEGERRADMGQSCVGGGGKRK
eukprot:Sspe_Gene.110041::Locus_90336_Transcript_1_1_Confidence_1.000_Length_1064::g.110041::m.110041